MLHARIVPPVAADDHSMAYSRQTLSFEWSAAEAERLPGAVQPLVRTNPRRGRRSLYLASYASRIADWPVPVFRHGWRAGDLVIWDNLATMHRGRPFDDRKHKRELRRVTTLDLPVLSSVHQA